MPHPRTIHRATFLPPKQRAAGGKASSGGTESERENGIKVIAKLFHFQRFPRDPDREYDYVTSSSCLDSMRRETQALSRAKQHGLAGKAVVGYWGVFKGTFSGDEDGRSAFGDDQEQVWIVVVEDVGKALTGEDDWSGVDREMK